MNPDFEATLLQLASAQSDTPRDAELAQWVVDRASYISIVRLLEIQNTHNAANPYYGKLYGSNVAPARAIMELVYKVDDLLGYRDE